MKDSESRFGLVSIFNHWAAAAAMIALLAIGLLFEELPRGAERTFLKDLHVSLGMAVLALLAFRVAWRLYHAFPQALPAPDWQQKSAKAVHWLLLLTIVVLIVTGPLSVWTGGRPIDVFGLVSLPSPFARFEDLHEALEVVHTVAAKPVLLSLLGLHVLAVAKHAVIDRDGMLARMVRAREG